MNISAPIHGYRRKAFPVGLAGLSVGTLDASIAGARYYLETGISPAVGFKFIARGVFGKAALAGGTSMILAIVGFHLIAFGWALEYALPRSHTGGVGYISYEPGIVCATVIWCAMTFATHPLSRAPRIPLTPWGVVCDVDLVVLDPEPKAR